MTIVVFAVFVCLAMAGCDGVSSVFVCQRARAGPDGMRSVGMMAVTMVTGFVVTFVTRFRMRVVTFVVRVVTFVMAVVMMFGSASPYESLSVLFVPLP